MKGASRNATPRIINDGNSTLRGPQRSTRRPATGMQAAVDNIISETAPLIWERLQPNSSASGPLTRPMDANPKAAGPVDMPNRATTTTSQPRVKGRDESVEMDMKPKA